MRVIGLTGSIACGKSTVAATLRELGAAVIDGDAISRSLTSPGGEALPKLRAAFGDGIFLSDGTLDRKKLGRMVFGDPEALRRLDDLMQPMIFAAILRDILREREAGRQLCVLDMPLLFEKGLDRLCERVWCVSLSREKQLERLMQRDGLTLREAEDRIASQMSTEEKCARSQIIINTSGAITDTQAMIPPLYEEEIALSESRRIYGTAAGTPENAPAQ